MTTLMTWLAALPEAVLRDRPQLAIVYAWGLAMSGQLALAEHWLREVERRLPGDDPALAGEVTVVRARIALIQGNCARSVELARQALAQLPRAELALRAVNDLSLGSASIPLGDLDTASRSFARASGAYTMLGQPAQALLPRRQLARAQLTHGRLNLLAGTSREALRLAHESGQRSPLVGYSHLSHAELSYERNDLPAAERHFAAGLALVELGGTHDLLNLTNLTDAHLGLARLELARGDAAGALELARRTEPLWLRVAQATRAPTGADTGQPGHPLGDAGGARPASAYLDRIAACRVRLWLSRGELDAAQAWAEHAARGVVEEITPLHEPRLATLARVWIARDDGARAVALLERLLGAAASAGRLGRVVEALGLRALALRSQGQRSAAVSTLERALVLAEPEGYVRTFVDEGPAMAALLREVHGRAVAPAYLATLLGAFHTSDSIEVSPTSPAALFTGRELEVLRLLARGRSNREVARELVVETSTVKTHLVHLYAKLGVNSRTQAIARARGLRLLD
jgi:LuxR family transcriptional regulator, maltose regulon positive regulatory protein